MLFSFGEDTEDFLSETSGVNEEFYLESLKIASVGKTNMKEGMCN